MKCLFFMKFHWNFMKKKGPLNEITSLRSLFPTHTKKTGRNKKMKKITKMPDARHVESHAGAAQACFVLRTIPSTSSVRELRRVHSCGKFAAVQSGVCLYAWAAARPERCVSVCLGSSTQHGSPRAFSRFVAVSAGVRSV
jgi:hypothetical protein